MSYVRTAMLSGTGAAVAALAAIALLSRYEGHSAARPVNATSHVLWGPDDAPRDGIDTRHTLPGLVINAGSAFFWAALFALGTAGRSRMSGPALVGRAFATTLLAAIVDYGLVPSRLRPGWELALKARSVAAALGAMGAGLAVGGLAARGREAPPPERAE